MADPVCSRQISVLCTIVVDVDASSPDCEPCVEEAKHLVDLKLAEAMQDHNEFTAANIAGYRITYAEPLLEDFEWAAWVKAEYPEPVED